MPYRFFYCGPLLIELHGLISCIGMYDLKSQMILISSVAHSEAVLQTSEKISHSGMSVPFDSVLSRANRSGSAYRIRGVAAS